MKIVVAGLGVMGASLALAIRNNDPSCILWGYDRPDVLEEARKRDIIHHAVKNWPADCADADIVFLATPIDIIRQHLTDLNGVVGPQTIVSDLGSTKVLLDDHVRTLKFSGRYIGGHPMTGAEKSGLDAANPLLYENAVYVLSGLNQEKNNPDGAPLISLLNKIKARIILLPPADHDRIMAYISHLPQLLAVTLINTVGAHNSDESPFFELAAGGFRDLTRIASSSVRIWQDIIDSNRKAVEEALEEFGTLLNRIRRSLKQLAPFFDKANGYREEIPRHSKGFLSPLTDILVYVDDKAGVIARISNALFEKNIDIRDIELLKIREKEGGVFRLSFDSELNAREAIIVLENHGFKAFVKE